MSEAVLRIYLPISAKAPGKKTVWRDIFGQSLARYLLRKAKDFGIEQAIVQQVSAGYLKGHEIVASIVEVPTPDLPQCVELIDSFQNLKKFAIENEAVLRECKLVFLRAESQVEVNL